MIAIYLNTSEWGGVDVLTARLSTYLTSRKIKFCIIEPKEGRIRKELPNVYFVSLEEVHGISHLITHVFFPSVNKLRDPVFPWNDLSHAKVLTWIVHPNDVFCGFFPFSGMLIRLIGYQAAFLLRCIFRSHARIYDKFFCKLVEKNALIVIDGATQRSLKFFVPTISTTPITVPIPSVLSESVPKSKTEKGLSIGYLGRMDSMKWSAVKPFVLKVLAPLASNQKITLHVISEGSHLLKLEKLCKNNNIGFQGYGYRPNAEARQIIISKTDVAVAMGTSALDLAGSGHPCIVLDPSLGMFAHRQNLFRYIHETDDFTLGEYRDFPGYVRGRANFSTLIEPSELISASALSKSYINSSHNPDQCFKNLFDCLQGSQIKIEELHRYIRSLEESFSSVKANLLFAVLRS